MRGYRPRRDHARGGEAEEDPAGLGRLASLLELEREQRRVEVRQDGRARAEARRAIKRRNRALRREQPR